MSGLAATSGAPPRRPAAALPEQRFDAHRIIAFTGMVFGMFMSILDIQIVSASLNEIQAGLSAGADEVTWVQTSYLIAEVIMIPLSGFLSRAFSTRYIYTACAGGFTLMSFLCAHATSIEQMIVFRALQGFIGGGMIPTVFASAFTVFPPSKRVIVQPIIGLVATLAPTIGPTAGGYLTDLFSWHWLFLVNVAPGIMVTLVAWFMIDFDEPELGLLKGFDWAGLLSMAVFLGALEYVLEEGPSKSWFEEDVIVYAAIASALGALVFFWRSYVSRNPIVDLRIRSGSFWAGSLFSFVLGIGLYGLTYIYPVYLARVRGDTALMIGETMFVTGMMQMISAPLVGRVMMTVDSRILLAIGFANFAISCWLMTDMTKDWDFWQMFVPQLFRGSSLMMCMVPINSIAMGALPPQEMKNASGLFNLTRNLGGAVGLAIINTFLNNRWDLHLARLHEQVSWSSDMAQQWLATFTAAFARLGSDAPLAATRQLAAYVRREALVMALSDVFLLIGVIFAAMLLLIPFVRRPPMLGAVGDGH
ncbi:MAG: DHA2 family efflux MFS transporter permease subunit [Hyphomicrobiales bacterium]|nr:DHA2 family efflux MFS transporter permease subunit [Hyphomicrobiales bacterium]